MANKIENTSIESESKMNGEIIEGSGFEAHITGRILEKLQMPFGGVSVTLHAPNDTEVSQETTHQGIYDFWVTAPGLYTLVFLEEVSSKWQLTGDSEVLVTVQSNHEPITIADVIYELIVVEHSGRIYGHIASATGASVEGVTVNLYSANDDGEAGSLIGECVTDGGGTFHFFDLLVPSDYIVEFSDQDDDGMWERTSDRFLPIQLDLTHTVDDSLEALYKPVEVPFHIGGVALTMDGAPVSGLTVMLLDEDHKLIGEPCITEADGTYGFDVSEPGAYFVRFPVVDAEGDWEVRTESKLGVTLTLENPVNGDVNTYYQPVTPFIGQISGAVFNTSHEPLPFVEVILLDINRQPIGSDITGITGEYGFDFIRPCTYIIQFPDHNLVGGLERTSAAEISVSLTRQTPDANNINAEYQVIVRSPAPQIRLAQLNTSECGR